MQKAFHILIWVFLTAPVAVVAAPEVDEGSSSTDAGPHDFGIDGLFNRKGKWETVPEAPVTPADSVALDFDTKRIVKTSLGSKVEACWDEAKRVNFKENIVGVPRKTVLSHCLADTMTSIFDLALTQEKLKNSCGCEKNYSVNIAEGGIQQIPLAPNERFISPSDFEELKNVEKAPYLEKLFKCIDDARTVFPAKNALSQFQENPLRRLGGQPVAFDLQSCYTRLTSESLSKLGAGKQECSCSFSAKK